MMSRVTQSIRRWYRQMDTIFSEPEAWMLFKTVAILETVGWTFLIIGIAFRYFDWPLNDWAMALGGSAHGVIAIIYMLIVLFAHRSLGWTMKRFVFAELINAIPYAVFVFEIRVERERRRVQLAKV